MYFRGIIKNRPALGERALQELLADNLLKFNYFLTDVRGRNVKSYMKIPIPSTSDPSRERFLHTLSKHDVDIDDYYATYKKSSIPLQNSLSKLAVDIFEHYGCFVNQYSKYPTELATVINKQIQNGSIIRTEEGDFSIYNRDPFNFQFDEIENLVLGARTEPTATKHQPVNTTNQETRATTSLKNTTAADPYGADDTEKENCVTHHSSSGKSMDQQDGDAAGKRLCFIWQYRASLFPTS